MRALWYDVCMNSMFRFVIVTVVACTLTLSSASVVYADILSDLEASIRSVLLRDPHAVGIPSDQFEALVSALAKDAATRGIEAKRIDAGAMEEITAQTNSEASGFGAYGTETPSLPTGVWWLTLLGALVLIGVLAWLLRTLRRRAGHE